MKILTISFVVLLFIGLSFGQTNYYVDNNLGSDIVTNGTKPRNKAWKSIEYALNNISNPSNDSIIINIANGTYNLTNNQIDINRNFIYVKLLGSSAGNTIIEAESDTSLSKSRVIQIYGGNNVSIQNLTIQNGRAMTSGGGGGVYVDSAGTLNVDHCIITGNIGNSTGIGGGIACHWGNLIINNSTISNNIGQNLCYGGGVGIKNGNISITNSTISNNTSSSGGGIAVISDKGNTIFNITNSTISDNQGTFGIGGIRLDKYPADSTTVDTFHVTANINSCTIFHNNCPGPNGIGGIGVWHSQDGVNVYIKNSIVSGNISTIDSAHSDISGSIISEDYNLIEKAYISQISGQASHNIYGLSADCQPLALNNTLNGTMTCAITSNSPARNVIPYYLPNGSPLYDQRGAPRNGNFDIGAYEYWNDQNTFPVTEVAASNKLNPKSFQLFQNYPNPFNPSTVITYNIPKSGFVKLTVYNAIGQKVADLVQAYQASGNHKIIFGASGLPSGIYFYRLQQNSYVMTKKMILLK